MSVQTWSGVLLIAIGGLNFSVNFKFTHSIADTSSGTTNTQPAIISPSSPPSLSPSPQPSNLYSNPSTNHSTLKQSHNSNDFNNYRITSPPPPSSSIQRLSGQSGNPSTNRPTFLLHPSSSLQSPRFSNNFNNYQPSSSTPSKSKKEDGKKPLNLNFDGFLKTIASAIAVSAGGIILACGTKIGEGFGETLGKQSAEMLGKNISNSDTEKSGSS